MTGRYCGAAKRQGDGTCSRPAGWGTGHPGYGTCKLHLGSTRRHVAAATLAAAMAQLDAVKAALTEQYRAHRQRPAAPEPPEWLREDYWRRQFPAGPTLTDGLDGPPPEARS
jgi:hypothetical protein